MNRREWIKNSILAGAALAFVPNYKGFASNQESAQEGTISASQFGRDFVWGTATAAYQIEGASTVDEKQVSIWDSFTHRRSNIKDHSNGDVADDFYHSFPADLQMAKEIGAKAFRFSISWTRMVTGIDGQVNSKGIDFYNKLINKCLDLGLEPWVMLYHWDLPQSIEDLGGWANRRVVRFFVEYVDLCTKAFGDRVKNWMIINEPLGFTAFGYMTGTHAPGRKNLGAFLAAVHHTALCQAEGGRVVRRNVPNANVGTSFSCSPVDPFTDSEKDRKAAKSLDALMNRLFLEPCLGMGYPVADLPVLKRMDKYILGGDLDLLAFDFDFVGLQNYFRVVCRHSALVPFIHASEVPAKERNVPMNDLMCEINPDAMYRMIKQFDAYQKVKKIIISENGVCVPDVLENGAVHDKDRIAYLESYLKKALQAKDEGAKLGGYFVWSLLDNFEWSEGYRPRFGLVYVDYKTQKRFFKDSAFWYRDFLKR